MTAKADVDGAADTKGPEIRYMRDLIPNPGLETVLANVRTKGGDVTPTHVAACHPQNSHAFFVTERGAAVVEMSPA